MRYLSFITLAILMLETVSCTDKIENTTFTGITNRNEQGEITGSVDESDWNFDDTWNEVEHALFTESFELNCEIDNNHGIMAYPNPCNDIIYLNFYFDDNRRVAYRIVDNNYNIIYSTDNASSPMAISFDLLKIKKQVVRVYYKVLGEDCELRGHGDIKIN